MKSCVSDQGMSLVELMVIISVLSVLIATAAPSFENLVNKGKVQGLASSLEGSLIVARAEAIKRNDEIYVYNLGMASESSTGWCVIVTAADVAPSTLSCSSTSFNSAISVVQGENFKQVTIKNAISKMSFYPSLSIISTGMSYQLTTISMTGSQKVQVKVSNKSRIKQCATGGFSGFKSC